MPLFHFIGRHGVSTSRRALPDTHLLAVSKLVGNDGDLPGFFFDKSVASGCVNRFGLSWEYEKRRLPLGKEKEEEEEEEVRPQLSKTATSLSQNRGKGNKKKSY